MRAVLTRLSPLARRGGWAMAEYVAYPLMMFAATPLFLHLLGAAQYGQWMLLLTLTGFGGLAGLGMGPAATKEVAAARGARDMAQAAEGAGACLAITLLSAAAVSLVILLIGWGPGAVWLARIGDAATVAAITGFAAALIALEQIDQVYAGVLRGMERFDLSARIEVTAKFALVLVAAIAAWASGDVRWVFAAATGAIIARALAKRAAARRLLGAPLVPRWSGDRVREAFAFGKWVWVQGIGSMLFAVADRLLVGALLGAEALARYSIALQLAQQVQTIPAAGAQVLLPAVARGERTAKLERRLELRATLLVSAIAAIGALFLVLLGRPLLEIWVGAAIAHEVWPVLPWLAVAYALLAVPTAVFFVRLGSGDERRVAICSLLAAGAGLAALLIGFAELGLVAAAMSRIAYATVMTTGLWKLDDRPDEAA